LYLRLFIPLNKKLTRSLQVPSYTFKNICYQARGKEKGEGTFNLLIKVKKHPGSLSEIHSAVKEELLSQL